MNDIQTAKQVVEYALKLDERRLAKIFENWECTGELGPISQAWLIDRLRAARPVIESPFEKLNEWWASGEGRGYTVVKNASGGGEVELRFPTLLKQDAWYSMTTDVDGTIESTIENANRSIAAAEGT